VKEKKEKKKEKKKRVDCKYWYVSISKLLTYILTYFSSNTRKAKDGGGEEGEKGKEARRWTR